MRTYSLKNVEIKTNSKVSKIYPVKPKEDGSLHDTVGIKITREQAIDLARNLLIGASEWDDMRVIAFRKGSHVTVTTCKSGNEEDFLIFD